MYMYNNYITWWYDRLAALIIYEFRPEHEYISNGDFKSLLHFYIYLIQPK